MPRAENGGGSEAIACEPGRRGRRLGSQAIPDVVPRVDRRHPTARLLARPKPPTVKDAGERGRLPSQPQAGVSCLGPWMTEA